MERRFFEVDELRAETTDGVKQIVGLIPYNSRSSDLGGFEEEILPGAFARTLRERDQVALWSHDRSKPLGRRSTGTLRLEDTPRGLRIEIVPPETSWGRDAMISVERGDVGQMSFGFTVPQGGDMWRERAGRVTRSLVDVDLLEVSPVAFGAYPKSQAATREMYGDVPEIPAEFAGASGSAETERTLQAQRAQRERTILIETIGA